MSQDKQPKVCFVIGPIGEEESRTRTRADKVLRNVMLPAAELAGYKIIRSDQISKAGVVTNQIIEQLVNAEAVLADLTDSNPNVFWEVGVRHAVGKPIITLLEKGQRLPFDLAPVRTVMLDHTDLDSARVCMEEIHKQLVELDKNPGSFSSPVTLAMTHSVLARMTEDPAAQAQIEMRNMIELLGTQTSQLENLVASLAPSLTFDSMRNTTPTALAEGELFYTTVQKATEIIRTFNLKSYRTKALEEIDAAWIANSKWEILKSICETLRQDQRFRESATDYFKATLFRVEGKDKLSYDNCFYPPGSQPTTTHITRHRAKPLPTAFLCLDSKSIQIIPNVRKEAKLPKGRWVPLWDGQEKNYGSMFCSPITIGDRADQSYAVVSILTVDTNIVDFFSEQQKDKARLSNLLAPFRQLLSMLYLMEARHVSR